MPIFEVGKVYRIWTPKGGPPQYVCLPSGLFQARSGRILQQSGPNQATLLPWYLLLRWLASTTLHGHSDRPTQDTGST